LSRPRELSKLLSISTDIATDSELVSSVAGASAQTLSQANTYTNSASSSLVSYTNSQVNQAIVTASAYTSSRINSLIDSAPGTLDTLNEIAEALNNNPDILDLYLTQTSASSTYVTKESTELIKYGSVQPSTPETGTIWIDTTDPTALIIKAYNGTSWLEISSAGGGGGLAASMLLMGV
jgi:hypothetical protein